MPGSDPGEEGAAPSSPATLAELRVRLPSLSTISITLLYGRGSLRHVNRRPPGKTLPSSAEMWVRLPPAATVI